MTVAVANRSVVLADSKIVSGNVHYECDKIADVTVNGERYLIVGAGSGRDHDIFVQHFAAHGFHVADDVYSEEFEAIVLGPKGLYHIDSGGSPGLVRRGWFAIGSGGDVAIGAIAQQIGTEDREPTAHELRNAIATAIRWSECGGRIDEMWLDPKKAIR